MSDESRKASCLERAVLDSLFNLPFPSSDALRTCIENAAVRTLDTNGSFKIVSKCTATADTLSTVPVEGEVNDEDDVPIHVLLHVKNGQPVELEIYKEDGSSIRNSERLLNLIVYSLPPVPGLEDIPGITLHITPRIPGRIRLR